jgi:acyl carrier protein
MSDQQDLMALLRSIACEVTGKPLPEIGPETVIAEAEIDSVSIAEIVTTIEDRLGIEVPTAQWIRARTFQDFLDVIHRARQ